MATVFRVEARFSVLDKNYERAYYSTNLGPYVGLLWIPKNIGYDWLRLRTSMEFQPEPKEDGMKFVPGSYCSGFKDMEQYLSWFRNDMAVLEWSGFILVEYEVPDDKIVHGRSQIAFSINDATIVKYHYSTREAYREYKNSKRVLAGTE